jgi:tetratricopeptide (TPR) repeat protein
MGVVLSAIPSYKEYARAAAIADWDTAICRLEDTIRAVKAQDPGEKICHLLQTLGNVYARRGDPTKGLEFFEQAEREDPQWLYPKYETGVYLAKQLERYREAIGKCDEILAALQSGPLREEEFREDYYVCQCLSLRAFCLYFLEGREAGSAVLKQVSLLENLTPSSLLMELVERFLEERVFFAECLAYLEKLRAQLSRTPLGKYSEEEIDHIDHLMAKARTQGGG